MLSRDLGLPENKNLQVTTKTNLIAVFQSLIAVEEFLTNEMLGQLAPSYKAETKNVYNDNFHPFHTKSHGITFLVTKRIMSVLQNALGYDRKDEVDNGTLHKITTSYTNARVGKIRQHLQTGTTPQDPQDAFTSLLLRLIDRAIVYGFKKTPMRTSDEDDEIGWDRVKTRIEIVERIMDDPGEKEKLSTDFASLIPVECRGQESPPPWEVPQ